MGQIIRSGSSFLHYIYLRNGSCWISQLTAKKGKGLITGTTVNEALHAELQRWNEHVTEQHIERPQLLSVLSPLYKMITHRSASVYPTTFQSPQPSIMYCVIGHLHCFLDVDEGDVATNHTCSKVPDQSSPSSHAPEPCIQTKSSICLDGDKAHRRKLLPSKKAKRVRKERAIRAEKGRRYIKKPRVSEMKRTVFNSERK